MRTSSAMKLLSTCCGGLLMSMSVEAEKRVWEYRTTADKNDPLGCVNSVQREVRYIEVEVFDYNESPWFEATWTQTTDKCGNPLAPGTGASWTFEYYAGEEVINPVYKVPLGGVETTYPAKLNGVRLQADMYMCAPWGDYELTLKTKSTNNGEPMEYVAWEVEYGPDQYHLWDTLNTPFMDGYKDSNTVYPKGSGTRNGGAVPAYAPIPPDGVEATYKWPIDGAEGYYSLMYVGPFPPLTGKDCPNLMPTGVTYMGCYNGQSGWTTDGFTPQGTDNNKDPAEPYRLHDGYDDQGLGEDGVMTLEICKTKCEGYTYMGLRDATDCICGNSLTGNDIDKCDLEDDEAIPEYKYLCSGESRVLCGTNTKISVYEIDPNATPGPGPTPVNPGPTPTTPTPQPMPSPGSGPTPSWPKCAKDSRSSRIMPKGPYTADVMSAAICSDECADKLPGFKFYGTQFGKQCFCATDVDSVTFGHDKCTKPCAGNPGEICGGNDAMSVYEAGSGPSPTTPTPMPATPTPPTPMPATPTPPSNTPYTSEGCFVDNDGGERVMERFAPGFGKNTKMSAEICYDACVKLNKGYTHFGLQFKWQCWCSKTFDADNEVPADGECTMDCVDNTSEKCGGKDRMLAYEIN